MVVPPPPPHIPPVLRVCEVRCHLIVSIILSVIFLFLQLTTAGTCAFLIGKVFVYSVSIICIFIVFVGSLQALKCICLVGLFCEGSNLNAHFFNGIYNLRKFSFLKVTCISWR